MAHVRLFSLFRHTVMNKHNFSYKSPFASACPRIVCKSDIETAEVTNKFQVPQTPATMVVVKAINGNNKDYEDLFQEDNENEVKSQMRTGTTESIHATSYGVFGTGQRMGEHLRGFPRHDWNERVANSRWIRRLYDYTLGINTDRVQIYKFGDQEPNSSTMSFINPGGFQVKDYCSTRLTIVRVDRVVLENGLGRGASLFGWQNAQNYYLIQYGDLYKHFISGNTNPAIDCGGKKVDEHGWCTSYNGPTRDSNWNVYGYVFRRMVKIEMTGHNLFRHALSEDLKSQKNGEKWPFTSLLDKDYHDGLFAQTGPLYMSPEQRWRCTFDVAFPSYLRVKDIQSKVTHTLFWWES